MQQKLPTLFIRILIIALTTAVIATRQVRPDILIFLANIPLDPTTLILLTVLLIAIFFPLLKKMALAIAKIQRRWFLIALCFILLLLKIIFPSTQIDSNVIWLIAITAILFVLPELRTLTPYVKRIKIGDAEIELKEKIEDLEKEVEKAQTSAEETEFDNSTSPEVAEKVSAETAAILHEASKNPQAALLLLSARIEEQLRKRIEEGGIPVPKTYSIVRLAELGVQNKVFPFDFLAAFRDFAAVRNRVAHGQAFDVDRSVVLSVISLGTELLKIASTITPRAGSSPYHDEQN